jgi:hypothetical protein
MRAGLGTAQYWHRQKDSIFNLQFISPFASIALLAAWRFQATARKVPCPKVAQTGLHAALHFIRQAWAKSSPTLPFARD